MSKSCELLLQITVIMKYIGTIVQTTGIHECIYIVDMYIVSIVLGFLYVIGILYFPLPTHKLILLKK